MGFRPPARLLLCALLAAVEWPTTARASSPGCAFHTLDGVAAESEGVRFIRVREDAEVGREILWLRAYPRATVALRSSEGSGDHKYFALTEVNTTTVLVTLARSLEDLVDRDVPRNLLKFRIMCAAKNEKVEEASHMSITVYIEDVNDNAPEFVHTPYEVEVDESTPTGSIVFEGIQAFDRDKPNTPNSEVHFGLSTPADQLAADGSPYFALKSPHRPLLVLKRELDFDAGIRVFRLPLVAWDRGSPANQANTTIVVRVRDVDDLPPKFTEGVYRTKINEFHPLTGIPIRVPLYFSPPIMAFDQDSLNATLVYDLISGNERQLFRANPNNGVLYLQKEVDLEEESLPGNTFVLQMEARQKDNALKKALARLEVEILDLNDNAPEFEADFYNISIVENLPTGFSVLQVNAVDRDQGENAEFLYGLVDEDPTVAGAFRIDARSGWITVRDDRLLDRERRRSIHLVVEAIERNPPHLVGVESTRSSQVKVEITLLDTNDNTPKFEAGNLYEFKVAVTAPVGHRVGHVVALDPDEGPNGQLLYELQRPKGSGYVPFALDRKNGTISVAGPLRRGRIAVFVEASDQPTNPSERRFSLAVITIEVYATVDDQAIDFVGAPYEFWVGGSAPLGTSVGQVRTTLVQDGEDEIMYDLLHTYAEGVPFAIEERSGIITVVRELQEFSRLVYHFEAVANYLFANSSQPLLMGRSAQPLLTTVPAPAPDPSDEGVLITNVTIHVVAKPEARVPLRPVIEEINMNVITFHVEENLAGGVIGQLLYKNGINVVNNELGSYRDLEATSAAAAAAATATATVTATVGNATIGSRFRSRSRSRSSGGRTAGRGPRRRVARRLIGDSTNVKLRYIIANQQEVLNRISITEDGTLLTLTGLDREQQPAYDLIVIVEYSTGLISGAGIYQVHVRVDDVNDNAPRFAAPAFVGLIAENSAAGSELSLSQPLVVADADEGANAEFRLVLQGEHSDAFALERIATAAAAVGGGRGRLFSLFNLTEQWHEEPGFGEMQALFLESSVSASVPTSPTSSSSANAHSYRITYTGRRPLDREKDQVYHLQLLAVDSGGLKGAATLSVLVADVNDNAPMFERISVFKEARVEIREYTTDMEIYFVESAGQSSSAPVGAGPSYLIPGSPRLHPDEGGFDGLGGPGGFNGSKGFHRFSGLRDGSNFTKASNGSTAAASQRRQRSRSRARPRHRNSRGASSSPSSSSLSPGSLRCPLFAVLEDLPLATKLLQVTASDEDFGRNAQVHYEITGEHVDRPPGAPLGAGLGLGLGAGSSLGAASRLPGVRYFAVDRVSGELAVNFPLAAHHEILVNLSATDIDGLRDSTCLRFTVTDVNNHAPAFKRSWYSFDSAEGAHDDSVLGQVLAIDLDYGQNANVSYALSDPGLPFRVKPHSGVLRVVGPLDRELRPKYNFQVIATDNAEPLLARLSSAVDVEVNVLDVNDNRPEFVGYDELVRVDRSLNNDVLQLNPDAVKATNGNSNNDDERLLPLYKAYLDRGTGPGMFVKQVTAIDKDDVGNGNGLVLYAIAHRDPQAPLFQIDSRDGAITTLASLGAFDRYEHVNVTVVASDLGSPALSATALVLVNLQGQSQAAPEAGLVEAEGGGEGEGEGEGGERKTKETWADPSNGTLLLFQHQYFEVQVAENNEAPTELMRLNLSAAAAPPDAYRWTLFLERGGHHEEAEGAETEAEAEAEAFEEVETAFEVDGRTGDLRALRPLDREAVARYQLRVRVERANREGRTYARVAYPVQDERVEGLAANECRVVVVVLDENDNTPRFRGGGRPIVAVAPRSATFGYPVTTVEARDADAGLNAEIRYRLLNEHSRLFAVDELSGRIRLVASLPLDDAERVYGFDVKATDRGGADDGRSSIANVFVYVIDEARQVRLVVAGRPLEVERRIDALLAVLSEAIQMEVRVRLLEPHVGGLEPATDAYVYAVDSRTNAVMDMEQLQESLAGLQLDALQLQHQLLREQMAKAGVGGGGGSDSAMPRIIELAEFGQLARQPQATGSLMGGAEIVGVVLLALCALGAGLTTLCFVCLRQKRGGAWSQQEFPTSETGLTYTIAPAGAGSCRQQRRRRQQQLQQTQQSQGGGKSGQGNNNNNSFVPESVCSSAQSQSTVAATQKLEQQQQQQLIHHHQHPHPHQHQHQHHQHPHYHQHHHHQQQQQQQLPNNESRAREYIDVPLPKSIAKAAAASRCPPLEPEQQPASFVLKYNACQPVNNLSSNPYEASMFSLHSAGQDSGVDFLSSRELYETSPESFGGAATKGGPGQQQLLCPRHANEQAAAVHGVRHGHGFNATDSSDNYEDSLKNSNNGSGGSHSNVAALCEFHRHDYQNTRFGFEKRSCVRHSFSGVKDDLMQGSPHISLRPRGHALRNSMNDLEERLHNLEQSFRRPPLDPMGKPSSIF